MDDSDDIRPAIGDNGRKNPFIVPEGYFSSFEDRLKEQISSLEGPARARERRNILHPIFMYVTGICLLIISSIIISHSFHDSRSSKWNSEPRIVNLVQYSLENIDEQTIIEALPKTYIEPAASEITTEEVMNYMQEQNIDMNNYNEEL